MAKEIETIKKPDNFLARKISFKFVAISLIVAVAVLVLDLSLPLGVAAGVPYVALVLIGIWFPRAWHIYLLAVLGTVLTVIGYINSPDGGIFWVVITNRTLALFAIWITAVLIASRKKFENALHQSRDNLESDVAKRTTELRLSEERFRDFTESTSDWLWEQDKDFNFTYITAFKSNSLSDHQQKALGQTVAQ